MVDTTGGTGGDSRTIDGLLSDKKTNCNSQDNHENKSRYNNMMLIIKLYILGIRI